MGNLAAAAPPAVSVGGVDCCDLGFFATWAALCARARRKSSEYAGEWSIGGVGASPSAFLRSLGHLPCMEPRPAPPLGQWWHPGQSVVLCVGRRAAVELRRDHAAAVGAGWGGPETVSVPSRPPCFFQSLHGGEVPVDDQVPALEEAHKSLVGPPYLPALQEERDGVFPGFDASAGVSGSHRRSKIPFRVPPGES